MTISGIIFGLAQPLASANANAAVPAKGKKADRPAIKPVDRTATPFIPSEVEIRIENINDTRNGEVVHLKQVHHNGDPINQSDASLIPVGKNQYMIWKYLETEKIKHVFNEGRGNTEYNVPDSPSDPDARQLKLRLSQIFPGGLPANPTNFQLIILGCIGAADIYANFHSDVTIHPIATKEEMVSLLKATKEDESQWSGFEKNAPGNDLRTEILGYHTSGKRYKIVQRYAARHVMDYLHNNRGAKVALIFGAAHDFTQDFYWYEYNVRPRLTSVNYPGIIREFDVFIRESLETKYPSK